MERPVSYAIDKRIGIITSFVIVLIVFLILRFSYYMMADPPPEDIPLIASTEITELELEKLVIENGGSSGGAGTPTDDPVDPNPQPQIEKVVTSPKSKTSVKTGEGNQTNGNDPNAKPTTLVKGKNPFGGGNAETGTKQGLFGKDNGTEKGKEGSGGDGKGENGRVKLTSLNIDDLQSNQSCKIALKLSINAEGNVVTASNIAGQTTTTDQRLINQVIELVKRQIKYNKKEGAIIEKISLIVSVQAT
jgi:hypothetical protein